MQQEYSKFKYSFSYNKKMLSYYNNIFNTASSLIEWMEDDDVLKKITKLRRAGLEPTSDAYRAYKSIENARQVDFDYYDFRTYYALHDTPRWYDKIASVLKHYEYDIEEEVSMLFNNIDHLFKINPVLDYEGDPIIEYADKNLPESEKLTQFQLEQYFEDFEDEAKGQFPLQAVIDDIKRNKAKSGKVHFKVTQDVMSYTKAGNEREAKIHYNAFVKYEIEFQEEREVYYDNMLIDILYSCIMLKDALLKDGLKDLVESVLDDEDTDNALQDLMEF